MGKRGGLETSPERRGRLGANLALKDGKFGPERKVRRQRDRGTSTYLPVPIAISWVCFADDQVQ